MDLLFQRYASPFLLMDQYISSSRFEFFIKNFINTINQEKSDKANWEFYLHRVYDKSFEEFTEDIKDTQENLEISKQDQEATVLNSLNILGGFNPTNKG